MKPSRSSVMIDWSKVCMPYWVMPSATTWCSSGVRSGLMMYSRTVGVLTMTSTAGTRPAPSRRGTSRCEITARRFVAMDRRSSSCWCGG